MVVELDTSKVICNEDVMCLHQDEIERRLPKDVHDIKTILYFMSPRTRKKFESPTSEQPVVRKNKRPKYEPICFVEEVKEVRRKNARKEDQTPLSDVDVIGDSIISSYDDDFDEMMLLKTKQTSKKLLILL